MLTVISFAGYDKDNGGTPAKPIITVITEEEAIIEWDDGSAPETFTFQTLSIWCSHVFSVTTNRIIVIKGENITHPDCDFLQLTALDVSKNTALSNLDCAGNEFVVAGLDVLFGTLHANTEIKTIYIWGNPGTAGYNQSIATDKGWRVIAQ